MPKKGHKVYLSGPRGITALAITKIESGWTKRGVHLDLASVERQYRELPFKKFAELYLKPAFAELFRNA